MKVLRAGMMMTPPPTPHMPPRQPATVPVGSDTSGETDAAVEAEVVEVEERLRGRERWEGCRVGKRAARAARVATKCGLRRATTAIATVRATWRGAQHLPIDLAPSFNLRRQSIIFV